MPYKNSEKRRVYQREYRKRNKEKIRKQEKEWRENNLEQSREISRKAALKHYHSNREEINQKAAERNQTQEWKDYQTAWYQENKERILKMLSVRWKSDGEFRGRKLLYMRSRREELMNQVNEIKTGLGCSLCSEIDSACLDFHHTDPKNKESGVSQLVQRCHSMKRILEEIEKCDILCSNCHRKLHVGRFSEDEI